MSTNQPHGTTPQEAWQPPTVPAPPAPEPPRKSWFARHKILTGLLVLVVLAFLGSALNGGDTTTPGSDRAVGVAETANDSAAGDTAGQEAGSGDGSGDGAGAEDAAAEAPARTGQKVRDGQFEFTVTKVRTGVKSVGDQYLNQKAQGQYVLIDVTVTNIGDSAQLLADSAQKVYDAKGREFSADTTAAIYMKGNDVFLNEINPGNSVKGTLVFDMPKDAEPATIELHDSLFSGGVVVRLA